VRAAEETASCTSLPVTSRVSSDDVFGHKGHIRYLFPLPRMRTHGDVPSWRPPIVRCAASSARDRTSMHHDRLTGERMPIDRANEWVVHNR
jgi:hypothetical protein